MERRKRRGYYITPECEGPLLTFKYSGADLSPIYRHILSPIAEFFVSLTPTWLAPNSITLFGLLWMITSYGIFCYYCPNLDQAIRSPETVPRWIFLFNAIAMLCYQTLDNMDGKQARRTKSSSPLGLLFDHGCDSFNSILGSANWICAMGVGSHELFQLGVIVFAPMMAFYVCTWEEYYTGTLILPVINGPTEGLLGGAILSLTTWAWGAEYWHQTGWFDMVKPIVPGFVQQGLVNFLGGEVRNLDVMVLMTIILLMREMIEKAIFVARTYGRHAIVTLLPIISFVVLMISVGYKHDHIFARNPRTCFHLCSLLFCEMVTQLMLNRTTSTRFNPIRLVLVPLIILLVVPMTKNQHHDFVTIYTVALGMFLLFKVRIVIHEMCDVLGIWCFDIVTPYYKEEYVMNGKKD